MNTSATIRVTAIPVTIELLHPLIALAFGIVRHGVSLSALLFVFAVFQGVLVHELGHAWVARRFGASPSIRLAGFGGVTSWLGTLRGTRSGLWVALAGPAIGIVSGLMLELLAPRIPTWLPLTQSLVLDMAVVHWTWALFNLLPIVPLDGGKMMEAVLPRFSTEPQRWAFRVSVACAALGVLVGALARDLFLMLVLGQLGFQNWRALEQLGPARPASRRPTSPRPQARKPQRLGLRVIEGGKTDRTLH